MFARRLCLALMIAAVSAPATLAAPLQQQAWPECRTLKPGATFGQASAWLGGRGRRASFAVVDELPVTTYAFHRAARTCRVQIEEGIVLATPVLR
jgi:hypothetical protein